MVDARAVIRLWRSVRVLPDFRRLLGLRIASQFGEGLFQAGLAGALLFNPERAASPWAIAGAFAVLYLPYSLLGPFAGALLDRWDRRLVLVAANTGRLVMLVGVGVLLATRSSDLVVLCGALLINGLGRFVASGLSAAIPHVVAREQVVSMNSVATAAGAVATFLGAIAMLIPRHLFGADDTGASTVIFSTTVPIGIALLLALRFAPRALGPDDSARTVHGSVFYTVASGLWYGVRTAAAIPSVRATLTGLARFGVDTACPFQLLLALRRMGARRLESLFGAGEPDPDAPAENPRIQALVDSTDGFFLAEVDLDLRGEGTIMNTAQKGRSDLRLASLRRDRELVEQAREVAFELVDPDPELSANPVLADELQLLFSSDDEAFLFKS